MTTSTHNETIVLGGGCFWCVEAAYQLVKGVTKVESGYAGGKRPHPTYEQVSSHATGHAEVVQVTFDPDVVTLEQILDMFWTIHDPTTKDRQGNDVGPQYRSVILYASDAQKSAALKSKTEAQSYWDQHIVTEILPLEAFYPAEPEHQNFYRRNPAYGYCQVIINPKLAKLRAKFAPLLTS